MKEYFKYLRKFLMHSFMFILHSFAFFILLALITILPLIAATKLSAFLFGNLFLSYVFGIYYIYTATCHVIASTQDYGQKDTADNIRIIRSILFTVVSSLTILWLMYPGEERSFIQDIPYFETGIFSSNKNPFDDDSYDRDTYSLNTEYSCSNTPYCTEMSSCEEAEFYYFECGLDRLDRDNDGIPCESICN